jgi:hypothetical protein
MKEGGECLTHYGSWRGTRQQDLTLHATWKLYPAVMHGGVQFICPAMHGGGAKRVSLKNNFETKSNLNYILNLG